MMFEVDRNKDAFYKVNPPIRDINNRDELYKRFLAGDITMIGTDHAPHTVTEKSRDFDSAPGGMPGVETTMPIIMNMVRKDIIPLSQAVRMGANAPGQAFSLPKGDIAVGMDADFSIFDMRKVTRIDPKTLHSKCGHSQYGGMEAIFPDTVIIRGEVQVEGAEFCGESRGVDIYG
jgi:dihydroorotase